jgi:DNA primase
MKERLFMFIDISKILEEKIYPALWQILPSAFPEFGFKEKKNSFIASNKNFTKTLSGTPRPDRVQAYQNSPHGFVIHGGEFVTWLRYINGMQYPKGFDFIKAAKTLFEKVGEPFPERNLPDSAVRTLAERERKQNLLESFWSFCQAELSQASHALQYAQKRGVQGEKLDRFLGYFPSIGKIKAYLLKQGFTENEIGFTYQEVSLGKELGSGVLYDTRWEGRLIGVWRDRFGRITNFWARDLSGKAKDHEKYLMLKDGNKDSPYGLDLVKGSEAILVEGFLDALPLWPDVPAISLGGAAINPKQIENITKAMVNSVTINLDYDAPQGAGHKGTLQIIETLVKAKLPFQLYVVPPDLMASDPQTKVDPNDYIVAHGLPAYQNLLQRSQKALTYLAEISLQKRDLTTDKGKTRAIEYLLPFDELLERETDREDLWRVVAEKTGYSLTTLLLENQTKRRKGTQRKKLKELEDALPASELLAIFDIPKTDPLSRKDIFHIYQTVTGCKDFNKTVVDLGKLATIYKQRLEEVTQIPEYPIIEEKEFSPKTTAKLRDALANIQDHEVRIILGGTGVGKTYHMILEMIEDMKKGQNSTLFCSTLTEARRAIFMLRKLLDDPKKISLNVSGGVWEVDPEEKFHNRIKVAKIAVSTYAYLGFMGHTARVYKIAPLLIKDRRIFCDEPQELWNRTKVSELLSARYLLKQSDNGKGTYVIQHRCPKSTRQGNCKWCFMAQQKTALDHNNERNFYTKISQASFASHQEQPELLVDWEKINADVDYHQIAGTLFFQPVEVGTKYDLKDFAFDTKENPSKGKSYAEYFSALISHIHNPHFRIQYPLLKENNEERLITPKTIILREELQQNAKHKDKIQFPILSCSIPTLSGINLVHYLQLFEAKSIVFATATMPEHMVYLLKDIAKKMNWKLQEIEVEEIPFKFDFTVLKMQERLSLERQAKVLEKIAAKSGVKIFAVNSKKSEALELYRYLKNTIPEQVRLFLRQDFVTQVEVEFTAPNYDGKGKITVTYAWSALTRGMDMPEIRLVVVDCSQFIPQAGLSDINPLMSKEEIYRSLLKEIAQNLTQILGRVMRSIKQRKVGETVIDNRNIVVLLHGLPSELMDFKTDIQFLNSWKEYRNDVAKQKTFVSMIENRVIDSLVESVLACLDGQEPANQFEIDKEKLKEKARNKGMESLSENQRHLVGDIKKEKEDEERLSLEEKAKLAATQMTWKEFYRKEHIERLSKREQKKIKKFF